MWSRLKDRIPRSSIWFRPSHYFDRALTMEWLVDGQKVQKYAIQVLNGAKWKTLYSGHHWPQEDRSFDRTAAHAYD